MELREFEMERWQSTWENRVEYNLSESGVHPLHLNELLDDAGSGLLDQSLGYSQTNGTEELRKTIASLYPKAGPENILVTNGSSEANFVAAWSFLNRDAQVAVMLPNYMQIWGVAKTLRATVRPFWLREAHGEWSPDLKALRKAVSKKTKLIAICNPNNPTGSILGAEIVDEICKIAKKAGAWILSDEVYHGAELDGVPTTSFWDRYDKVIVTNGLSKAYGLPGLRIGWIATGKELANRLWSYHDYTTICPSAISDYLARKVLRPEVREKILARTRDILRTNLPFVKRWVEDQKCISFIPPRAGAIAYMKYSLEINSIELAQRLVREKSTLIVPGDHFRMRHYMRIGYGSSQSYLLEGLGRVGDLMRGLLQNSVARRERRAA
jgi:aspartate/methionine/tyrosine aminotransferase